MNEDRLRAAVAAGVVASEEAHAQLLKSIVETARAIFGAKASSIFLFDESTDELVFEAVAGEGEEALVGTRIPSSSGIAGWTLVTRQPLVIEDLSQDPRHAREVAVKTGYLPKGLMSVPLLHEERALGVLQVLDRPHRPGFSLQEMDLLGLFANQAAISLHLLQQAREAKSVLDEAGGDVGVVARLAAVVQELDGPTRETGLGLLESLASLLKDKP